MTEVEGFRVSDLVASARLVLACIERGDVLTPDDEEVVWLRKTADAAREILPEKE